MRELYLLIGRLQQESRRLSAYDKHYEGEQPIRFIAPAMVEEFGERITPIVLNWGRLVVDANENRLDIEGFRMKGKPSGDEFLADVWQANDLDEQSQQGHLDSIALSRSYVITGAGDDKDDAPVVTVESPFQVYARRDSRTRRVASAVKTWTEGDAAIGLEQHAVLYLPDSTTHYVLSSGNWLVESRDEHALGRVPVVPLVNRPRILRPDGLSELRDIIPVADAANKMATDMMVSGEFHAMPRRWAAGVKDEDFQDEAGNPLNAWSRDAGTLWATENSDAKFGQFNESSLSVFHDTIRLLAQLTTQLAALPPQYMSFGGENPPSSDAWKSAEAQLVKRVERKQTYLGGGWEDVMRLVLRIETGEWSPGARSLETIWRDPYTPTRAQVADAAVKLATPIQNGRAIVPLEQTREDLGYTPEQRARMAEMDRDAERDPALADITDKLAGL